MKYNVGDKLTILNGYESFHLYDKGTVVTLTGFYRSSGGPSYIEVVDDGGISQTVGYSEVEPYVEPQEALTGEVMDQKDMIIELQRVVIESLVRSLTTLEKDLNELRWMMEGLRK